MENTKEARRAAALKAAATTAERRAEMFSAARANLTAELQIAWDREGHKFMREQAARVRGVSDRINAASMISQAFAETYGAEGMYGAEGDRAYLTAAINAEYGETWANAQEQKHYASMVVDLAAKRSAAARQAWATRRAMAAVPF